MLKLDGKVIAAHPEVMAVARTLGYDPLTIDDEALGKRYRLEGSDLKLTDLPGPVLERRLQE